VTTSEYPLLYVFNNVFCCLILLPRGSFEWCPVSSQVHWEDVCQCTLPSSQGRSKVFAKFDILFQRKLTGAIWGYLENKPMPSLRADDAATS
jgi:hypothetical protein